ncbi:MAG: hypothetical protein IMF02_00990 [Proteobacteria bacterium]|nr:hypothetical protein [Pseudomonadota bacterium]
MVRTKEPLDSSRHKAGHKFTAMLEADLAVGKTVVASRRSNIYGELTQAKQAGRVVGKSELTIAFARRLLSVVGCRTKLTDFISLIWKKNKIHKQKGGKQ